MCVPAGQHDDDGTRRIRSHAETLPDHERGPEDQREVEHLRQNLARFESAQLRQAELIKEDIHDVLFFIISLGMGGGAMRRRLPTWAAVRGSQIVGPGGES